MTGIGSIRFQALSATRLHEMQLNQSVSTVSREEADNGASFSDVVRLASRQNDSENSKVPLSVYLSRAAQFRAQLKKPKTEETQKSECPIDKARAESTTGANAPLNWLMADQFGGQAEFAPSVEDFQFSSAALSSSDSGAEVFSAQPKVASEPQSLLADEWLLSPCA